MTNSLIMQYSQYIMVQAVKSCNEQYNGKFFYGVKTTKIFCLPSCKAKMPKVENIEFFSSQLEAKEAGYRGCKRCKSENYPRIQPEWYTKLLKYFEEHLNSKINIRQFSKVTGVHYNTIRNYFLQEQNTTASKVFRKMKLEYAWREVRIGKDYRDVALDLGYESMSGFRDAFSKEFGINPGAVISAI